MKMKDSDWMEALAATADGLNIACESLARLASSHIGTKLFTLMAFDTATSEGCRFYSSNPDAYPVSGRKPIPDGRWSQTVIDRHEVFRANSLCEIAEVFHDHALIASLGCGAIINLPVVVSDRLIGTINCLDAEGMYGPDKAAAAADLKLPGVACFLLAQSQLNCGGA